MSKFKDKKSHIENRQLSLLSACCNIYFYAREICRRVLRQRVVILSFMPASYVDEIYDRVPGYRVSWPRAKNDESAGHVIKCRVCWPRAKNDESAGHVFKCRVCWPRAKNDESAGHVIKCRMSWPGAQNYESRQF